MHQMDPENEPTIMDNDSLYLYVNNDIKYGLFENIVDSYYLDSQIKDLTTTVTHNIETLQ